MQIRSIRNLAILAGMAGFAMLIAPAPARANLTISYAASDSFGGSSSGTSTGTTSSVDLTINAIQVGNIQLQGSSSASQSATIGTVTSQTIAITNTGSATDTITVNFTVTGYTLPSITGILTSSASGTSPGLVGPADTATLQSYANVGSSSNPFSGVTTGAQVGAGGLTYNFGSSAVLTKPFQSFGGYSLGDTFVITLGAGDKANLTLSTFVNAAPEPGTIAMALTALPVLALVARARRRRTVA